MPPPTHRKRRSVFSSDTAHTLPVYAAAADDDDDDRPPDYPDSAEEADRDTDSSDDVPPPPPAPFSLSSPRRRRFPSSHRRRPSGKTTADPFLDSLLARSVHALEMSNTLLQSSMSTQTALSTVFADSHADEVLESSVRSLSRRIEPRWVDDLAEISRGVDGLFAEADGGSAGGVSCSLPTSTSPMRRQKRRPLGGGLHREQAASASSLSLPLHAPLSSPKITETLPEPATPAYTMLSSFVSCATSASSTPAPRTSPLPAIPGFFSRRASVSPPTSFKAKAKLQPHEHDRSPSVQVRPMTPPAEESSSSSGSDTGCLAKRTVLSLRKILDDQPPLELEEPHPSPRRLRAPAFLPRTPAPVAQAATSTATASISRLYTKAKHTSSTRPPSPPRQSAMKPPRSHSTQSLVDAPENGDAKSPSPAPAPALRFPGLLGVRNWSTASLRSLGGSAPSSGRSTPKRISFAELPESYRSGSARFGRRERKRRGSRRRERGQDDVEGEEGEGEGWWGTWFLGGGGVAREERIERSWGARMPGAPPGFGPAVDEWPV
ncbi:hypothetical protein C0992_003564 [Termitomyces sp. T32_za158]|nr:hypothetical protein C0992_003564 [Termitomyces sp. T32_za158]